MKSATRIGRDGQHINRVAGGVEPLARNTQGSRAEQSVARALRRLLRARPYFYVINDLHLRRGDIDHIIIGPTGVFVVETIGFTGPVSLDGGMLTLNGSVPDRDPLRQARRVAAAVQSLLRMSGLKIRRVQPVV